MRLRPLWIFSTLVFLLIGGVATWIGLTIPNDVQAEAMLRRARNDLSKDRRDDTKQQLRTIIRRYPRTDAAATAVDTLFQMTEQDQAELRNQLDAANRDRAQLAARLASVEQKLSAPPPAPKPATISKANPTKKTTAKKKTSHKTTRRHSRRR